MFKEILSISLKWISVEMLDFRPEMKSS